VGCFKKKSAAKANGVEDYYFFCKKALAAVEDMKFKIEFGIDLKFVPNFISYSSQIS
jgi:hypothetical protein